MDERNRSDGMAVGTILDPGDTFHPIKNDYSAQVICICDYQGDIRAHDGDISDLDIGFHGASGFDGSWCPQDKRLHRSIGLESNTSSPEISKLSGDKIRIMRIF